MTKFNSEATVLFPGSPVNVAKLFTGFLTGENTSWIADIVEVRPKITLSELQSGTDVVFVSARGTEHQGEISYWNESDFALSLRMDYSPKILRYYHLSFVPRKDRTVVTLKLNSQIETGSFGGGPKPAGERQHFENTVIRISHRDGGSEIEGSNFD